MEFALLTSYTFMARNTDVWHDLDKAVSTSLGPQSCAELSVLQGLYSPPQAPGMHAAAQSAILRAGTLLGGQPRLWA